MWTPDAVSPLHTPELKSTLTIMPKTEEKMSMITPRDEETSTHTPCATQPQTASHHTPASHTTTESAHGFVHEAPGSACRSRPTPSPACAGQFAAQSASLAPSNTDHATASHEAFTSQSAHATQTSPQTPLHTATDSPAQDDGREGDHLSNVEWLQWTLAKAFPDGDIHVHDTRGDDQHIAVTVKSAVFAQMSRVTAHRRVYEALHHMRCGHIHALSVTTLSQ